MKIFQRKLFVFIFSVFVVIIACYSFNYFSMPDFYIKEFVYFIIITSIGFFAGNSVQHLAEAMQKNRNKEVDK